MNAVSDRLFSITNFIIDSFWSQLSIAQIAALFTEKGFPVNTSTIYCFMSLLPFPLTQEPLCLIIQ